MLKRKRTMERTQAGIGMTENDDETSPEVTMSTSASSTSSNRTSASSTSSNRTSIQTLCSPAIEPSMSADLSSFAVSERHPDDLAAAGLRPVWVGKVGYPGTMPDDIAEWIDPEHGSRRARLIGPLSSMFWLAKRDDLVAAIHNPACIMRDEIVSIPSNASIRSMVDHWVDSGLIPVDVYRTFFGNPQINILALPSIPSGVTNTVASFDLCTLFPFFRRQSLPQQVRCVRIRHDRNLDRQVRYIEREFTLPLGGNLLYRGLSTDALRLSMSLVLPVISSSNTDNEFGPGLYTTTSLEYALDYVNSQGALLVFQNPDFRALDVWEPNSADWDIIANYWTGGLVSNPFQRVPTGWDTDVIRGAISEAEPTRHGARVAGPDTQVVAVSYAGIEALSASLKMIIWFE